jgi:hypothetical protein
MSLQLPTKKRKTIEVIDRPEQKRKAAKPYQLVAGKWNRAIQELRDWHKDEEKKNKQESALQLRSQIAVESRLQSSGSQNVVRRLEDLRKCLYSTGIVPFRPQRQIFDLMCVVAIKWIIGDDFESYKPQLLKLFGLKKFFFDVHYEMPRQFGKTTIVGHGAAALSLTTPMKICIFSTGKRTASAMMKIIVRAIRNTPVTFAFSLSVCVSKTGAFFDREARNASSSATKKS